MYCTKCGNKLIENQKFCTSCGTEVNALDKDVKKQPLIVKCGNCDYVGPGEPARRKVFEILAWICVFFAPLITIIYFSVTHKYRCPKCKSTFIGIKNKDGVFVNKKHSLLAILIYILIGISIMGILASVVLASLNTAREKAKKVQGIVGTTELTYEVMQEVAKDHNNELPMMLDSETRWDSTEGVENGLIYKYTLVNYSLADLESVNLSELLRKEIVDGVCSSPEMEIYVKNGATLKYLYYDMNGLFIDGIIINTKTDCNKYQF